MKAFLFASLRSAVLLTLALAPASAQPPSTTATPPAEAVRVFIDCQDVYCDLDYFRTEITFVNYVRDRKDAEVHVLLTAQRTGGGGQEVTVSFIGLGRFAGTDARLRYVSKQTDTDDTVRLGLTRVLRLGLVRYVAETPLADQLQIVYRPLPRPQQGGGPATVRDPWNFWVFRSRLNGFFNGERSSSSASLSGGLSANRTTEAWKINLSLNGNYRDSRFQLREGRTFRNVTRDYSANGLVVKSLSDHWSAAVRSSVGSSTFLNQDLFTRAASGVEYNVFPYAESTRRQLTFQHTAGANRFDYEEETIFNKTAETLFDETLIASLSLKQPWGSISTAFEGSHYFHDPGKNRLVLFGDLDLRLFKGFSLNFGGNASRIRDQLSLAKGDISDPDILVRRRQLATSYRYFVSIGFSYTFGSIYNNVVNPRFGGASGGMVRFFF